ncbi:pyridoxamine 5'-phosphate oxidase family protein [Embleya sp. NBC_00896]|uniref:pyridoxamine 5'-phosphate oxidase family protein n=1 Tax=Embleya sp. NBC_00896 TaxID=2975961 RepID=UPI00386A9EF1|nr:TIGR03618 family F420-dependent PPOX class oxidoreductase [Embleya sp. NBC_00896]
MKPLKPSAEALLALPSVGTLTTIRPDGSPHVVTVRFTWDADAGLARVLTIDTTRKAQNLLAAPGSRAAICQPEGARWITLEGTATLSAEPHRVHEGVRRYLARYGSSPPAPPGRVLVEIAVDRVLGIH